MGHPVKRFLVTLVVIYAVSYVVLSRAGMSEARRQGYPYFFYVPFRTIGPDSSGLHLHHRLRLLYSPLNRLDRSLFGGEPPCHGIMWGLGGETG